MMFDQEFWHFDDLAWSSDGSLLAFNAAGGGPIRIEHVWIVGVDGSGLTEVSQEGDVRWSPDGGRRRFGSSHSESS